MLLAKLVPGLILLWACQDRSVSAWWLFSDPAPATGPIKAIANFDLDGVKGVFRFSQSAPNAPTVGDYDIHGLQGNNRLFHVHLRPVPPYDPAKVKSNATALAELCADPATGGHLNPHHITAKLPPKSAKADQYETGDLSGKHGPLVNMAGHPDHFVGTFTDENLPLSGEHSIVGRSLVFHKNDGKRWVCANIVELK